MRNGLMLAISGGVSAERKSLPASSSSTRRAPSSLSRAASVAPAEPAPTMITSKMSLIDGSNARRVPV